MEASDLSSIDARKGFRRRIMRMKPGPALKVSCFAILRLSRAPSLGLRLHLSLCPSLDCNGIWNKMLNGFELRPISAPDSKRCQ